MRRFWEKKNPSDTHVSGCIWMVTTWAATSCDNACELNLIVQQLCVYFVLMRDWEIKLRYPCAAGQKHPNIAQMLRVVFSVQHRISSWWRSGSGIFWMKSNMECFPSSLLISWLIWLWAFIVGGEAPHLITRLLHGEVFIFSTVSMEARRIMGNLGGIRPEWAFVDLHVKALTSIPASAEKSKEPGGEMSAVGEFKPQLIVLKHSRWWGDVCALLWRARAPLDSHRKN